MRPGRNSHAPNRRPRVEHRCARRRPVAEIHFGAHHAFSPQAVDVDKGQNIQIDNDTQQNLTVDSTPDLGVGMGHQIYHPGEQQTLLFDDSCLYTFRVEQVPGQLLRISVADTTAK